jgi:hypothetical protein
MRGDLAALHDHQLAWLDLADELRAHDIKRHRLGREDRRLTELAHHQRADAERIAAGDHPLRRHADQRIGAFELLQRVDEAIDQRAIMRCGDKVDDRLGIAGRLEDRARSDQVLPQAHGVGDVAVMRHREPAARQLGIERLDVAQRRLAGG